MNRYLNIIFSLTLLLFISCEKADYDSGSKDGTSTFLQAYGTVSEVVRYSESFTITSDDGELLYVETNLMPDFNVYVGQRVFFNYNVLNEISVVDAASQKYIKLYALKEIPLKYMRKDPVTSSSESIFMGIDAITPYNSWIGGDYLNVVHGIYVNPTSGKEHNINIIYKEYTLLKDTVIINLKHNANGDLPTEETAHLFEEEISVTSFDLNPILINQQDFITIIMFWSDYADNTFSQKELRSDTIKLQRTSTNINNSSGIGTINIDDGKSSNYLR